MESAGRERGKSEGIKTELKTRLHSWLLVHLLDEVHNFLLGGVAGDEVVQVLHDVHADVAGQVISGLNEGRSCEDERGEDEEDLGGGETLYVRGERREGCSFYLHYKNSESDLRQSGR